MEIIYFAAISLTHYFTSCIGALCRVTSHQGCPNHFCKECQNPQPCSPVIINLFSQFCVEKAYLMSFFFYYIIYTESSAFWQRVGSISSKIWSWQYRTSKEKVKKVGQGQSAFQEPQRALYTINNTRQSSFEAKAKHLHSPVPLQGPLLPRLLGELSVEQADPEVGRGRIQLLPSRIRLLLG